MALFSSLSRASRPFQRRMFSSIADKFEAAKARVSALKEDPGSAEKLNMYALFKQATDGVASGKRPGMTEFVKRAKYDAWSALATMSQEEAMKAYIEKVDALAAAEGGEGASAVPDVSEGDILVSRANRVLTLTLNRPKKLNSLTLDMYATIGDELDKAAVDDNISFAVLTATGNFYCAGNDLSNFMSMMAEPGDMASKSKKGRGVLHKFTEAMIRFPKPLIALVPGPAVGISVTTLALCDTVYCAESATFSTPFSSTGQSPEGISSFLFPRIMGMAPAMDMLLFERKLSSSDAASLGFVSRVFPDATFHKDTAALVEHFTTLPKGSMRAGKDLVRATMLDVMLETNDRECDALALRWQSDECRDAIASFFTRKPSKL